MSLVIDFERVQTTIIPLHIELANFYEFLETIRRRCKQLMATKQIEFSLNTDHSVPNWIYIDRIQFTQFLMNILTNAFKFTPSDRTVSVHVSFQNRPAVENGGTLAFEIRDTGPGISEEEMPHLFEAYTIITHENSLKGSGLGLSITKKIIDALKGSIRVESQVGVGTAFFVEVPVQCRVGDVCVEIDEETEENVDHDSIPLKRISGTSTITSPSKPLPDGLRILIVDDSFLNRTILKKILVKMLHEPTIKEAEDGVQALEVFSPRAFDVIFMDQVMPNMDGLEASGRIRLLDERVKIIICSASVVTDRRYVDSVLMKPFTMEQVAQEISKLV